jgi:hypothetical protein
LFALFYQSTMPVAKRQAWTAQQKLYAIELKRKSPDKKLDEIIVAIKAKYDRDVSVSTLHSWLKPEIAAKIEQLANASGHNDAKHARTCDHPHLEHALFLWYQGHETRGATVTGDLLTLKAKELALIPELEVSEGFVCSSGWLSNFKKRYSISSHVRHGEAGSAPAVGVELAKSTLRELLSALPDKNGENPVDVHPKDIFNMDESGLCYGQQPSRTLARERAAGNKKDKKHMTVGLVVNATGTEQLRPIIIHTAQKPRAFPKNFNVESALNVHWYCNKTAWMLSTVFQDWINKVRLDWTTP